MIARAALMDHLRAALARSPVTLLTGPRRAGKTTLAREFLSEDSPNYFDLEDPLSLARREEPTTALDPLHGLVVIDEVQRRPDLFPVLRVLSDRRKRPARFLILGKRQVKSPKVFVRDSGLLHQLLGLETEKALLSHPKVGASWEGFGIEQALAAEPHDEAFFLATHQGAEIDLVRRRGDRLFGVECKRADAPRVTPSIRIALDDLRLERVAVVHPGAKRFALAEQVEAVPLNALAEPGRLFEGETT